MSLNAVCSSRISLSRVSNNTRNVDVQKSIIMITCRTQL